MGVNLTKERSSDGNDTDGNKISNELLKFRSPENNSYVPDISLFQEEDMNTGDYPNTNAYESIDYALEENGLEENGGFSSG